MVFLFFEWSNAFAFGGGGAAKTRVKKEGGNSPVDLALFRKMFRQLVDANLPAKLVLAMWAR